MGIVVQFPADAASRQASGSVNLAPHEGTATVLILPVIRIERYAEKTDGRSSGPDEGKAPGRRRRRRVRS